MSRRYDAAKAAEIAAAEARLSGLSAVWAVTVSNGSGTKVVEVAGTQRTAWTWAEIAAERGGFGEGAWAPVSIAPAGPAAAEFEAI